MDRIPHTRVDSAQKKQLHEGIRLHDSVTVMAPLDRIYSYWRDFRNFPKFMDQLESVTEKSPTESHWIWKALKGQRIVEWDCETIDEVPNSHFSWQTIGNSHVKHAGSVWFRELPFNRGTVIQVQMVYHIPGGVVTSAVEKILGESPEKNLRKDLRQLKELLESGTIPTIEGQPRGGMKEELNPSLH